MQCVFGSRLGSILMIRRGKRSVVFFCTVFIAGVGIHVVWRSRRLLLHRVWLVAILIHSPHNPEGFLSIRFRGRHLLNDGEIGWLIDYIIKYSSKSTGPKYWAKWGGLTVLALVRIQLQEAYRMSSSGGI